MSSLKQPEQKPERKAKKRKKKKKIGFVIPVNHFQILQLGQHCSGDTRVDQRKAGKKPKAISQSTARSGTASISPRDALTIRPADARAHRARLRVRRRPAQKRKGLASVAGAAAGGRAPAWAPLAPEESGQRLRPTAGRGLKRRLPAQRGGRSSCTVCATPRRAVCRLTLERDNESLFPKNKQ